MSDFIAPKGGSRVGIFISRTRALVRLAALAAVLALAIHPSATNAVAPSIDAEGAGVTAGLARGGLAAIDCHGTGARPGPVIDDGEDHFDEGDDEFDCGGVDNDDDDCDRDSGERDDDCDGGCANFDDGEDRCLDGEDPARPQPTDGRPSAVPVPAATSAAVPTAAATAAAVPTAAAAQADLSTPGALAAVVGLGAGGLWLLRRTRG